MPGPAAVTGELPLDEHERTPWREGTPEAATGYVVDGDLVVDGNITDVDDGAAALIVLGNLRARNVYSTAPIGGLADPAPEAPLRSLLVPELLVTGAPGPDGIPEIGIRGDALRDRLLAGLPLTTNF
ncbi:hypothetical protein F5972_07210 [Microbispora cellulosiformans]|uniref:Uncharacterized protein n=1 Tax=Microbispora cellulosiformans TaxID=2614688 RepID=A0A5J5KB50_9ACTN|nr:hypothetical protein [Microbispora cellulosiformans]KAA9380868.1 hypothetical protein F5972_07210 [Microbispora cellulosiformans]